jgi:hypothetical protein
VKYGEKRKCSHPQNTITAKAIEDSAKIRMT